MIDFSRIPPVQAKNKAVGPQRPGLLLLAKHQRRQYNPHSKIRPAATPAVKFNTVLSIIL
jgi:hypothetical protein